MAVKIINDKPDAKVVKQVICRNCGVTLEYVPADTREEKRTDYTGDADNYKVIDCPKCNHKITV